MGDNSNQMNLNNNILTKECGKLFVCATPIGNLKDITIRVLETLEEVDLIAAEDTRHTIKLLNHYDIKTPMESYHQHNLESKGIKLINILKNGKNIALVSDAGMPGISDPGEDLIKLCYENNISITVLPGATASVTALVLSGIKCRSYCFEGFLPSGKKAREDVLNKIKNDSRTYIVYESPHHLIDTLKVILKKVGDREIAVIKELTKKHELVLKNNISSLITYFNENTPRGEYVLVICGEDQDILNQEQKKILEEIPIKEHVDMFLAEGLELKDAMKKVAKERKISKREVYSEIKIK